MIVCAGCINIENGEFPFISQSLQDLEDSNMQGQFYINNYEGCAVTQSDEHLQIFYCPVCGRKLSDERVRLTIDSYKD